MFEKALTFRENNTFEPNNWDEFKSAVERGFAVAHYCGSPECEDSIKELKATNRCIPLGIGVKESKPICVVCGKPSIDKAVFARSY